MLGLGGALEDAAKKFKEVGSGTKVGQSDLVAPLEESPPSTSTVDSWLVSPDSWDRLRINGRDVPGIVELTGSVGRKLDIKAPKGSAKATISDDGHEPAKVDAKLQIWTDEQWAEYCSIYSDCLDPCRKKREAVTIEHPSLSLSGLSKFYIESVSFPVMKQQVATVEIKAVEWAPPPAKPKKSASTTPKTAAPGGEGQTNPADAAAAQDSAAKANHASGADSTTKSENDSQITKAQPETTLPDEPLDAWLPGG